MKITAIVVARSGSVRLPGKALLPFAGKTLVGHKVHTLKQCSDITRVIVGSDSQEILDEGDDYGAEPVRRDAFHCDESRCSANQMIADMVKRVSGNDDDVIVWAHPTNPLIRAETYSRAIAAYRKGLALGFDSLASVTRVQRHAWVGGKPFNYNPWSGRHQTASNLEPIDFQDGAIFIQSRGQMFVNSYFFGNGPFLFPIGMVEGWDIDTAADYQAALSLWGSQEPSFSVPAHHSDA